MNPQDDASNKAGDAANENFDGNERFIKYSKQQFCKNLVTKRIYLSFFLSIITALW